MSFVIPNSDGKILPVSGTEQLYTDQIIDYLRDFMKVGDKITAVLGSQFRNSGLKLVTTITSIEKNKRGENYGFV